MTSPDLAQLWAERLAVAVAPDEIDIAPDVIAAYIAGGAARRELFASPRADPGAFGADIVVTLPYVVDALGTAYNAVRDFLAQPAVNSLIAGGSLLVSLIGRPGNVAAGSTDGPEDSPAEPHPSPPPPPVPSPDAEQAASAAVNSLAARLAETVATAERAEAMAAEILTALAAEPEGAAQFLDLLRATRG